MDGSPRSATATGRRTATVVMVTVVLLYLLPAAGHPPASNPNELVRLELALAAARWRTVHLDEAARIYGLSEDVARHEGHVVADKAPGLSMAAVPVVWLAGVLLPTIPGTDLPAYWPLRHLATCLLVALTTGLLCFGLAASIPELRRSGWIPLAGIAALSTPLWTYGTVFFGHAPAAALILVAWILLLRPLDGEDRSDGRHLVAGGVAAGFAVTIEYPTVLLVLVIVATLVARRTSLPRLGLVGLGLAGGWLPAMVYHHLAFGAPWLTGYSFKADPGFVEIHSTGLVGIALPTVESLWGVLLGPARGLLYFSPLFALAPIGLALIQRRHGWRESAPIIAATIIYVAFASGFVDWQAGWCAAARHLVPLLPVLLIPTLVAVAELAGRRWWLPLVAAIAAVAAIRGVLTLVVTPFFPPEFDRPLTQLVMPSLRDGVVAPTLPGAAFGVPSGVVWAAAAGLTAALLVWAFGRLGRVSTIWIAAIVLLTIAGQVGWLAWRSTARDPRQEVLRAQVLAGLGHSEAADRIMLNLASGTVSDGAGP